MAEAKSAGRTDLNFRRVFLADGSVAQELRKAFASEAQSVRCLPGSGNFIATAAEGQEPTWQMRPPPALRAGLASGTWSAEQYQEAAMADPPEPMPGCVLVLMLAASRAAVGVLNSVLPAEPKNPRDAAKGPSVLSESKIIKTYSVRGGDKQGTGRFQLFEDKRKRGSGFKSEGSKLRRRCAIRFFEKINEKLVEWRVSREGGPVTAVFFAGDPRLKHLLLECRKPACPLPTDKRRWIPLPGRHAGEAPSSVSLERAARFLCRGDVVELREDADGGGALGSDVPKAG